MFEKEYRWLLPVMVFLMLVAILAARWPQKQVWYQDIEDHQISSIEVTKLASWIVEGRNDFLVFSIGTAAVTNNIPNLVSLKDEAQLLELIKTKPNYKKWIILTGPSGIPAEVSGVLTQDWKRRVIQVEGGGAAWQAQISDKEIEWQKFSNEKAQRLRELRPFFHPTGQGSVKQKAYIAPKLIPLPFLRPAADEEVEEGC